MMAKFIAGGSLKWDWVAAAEAKTRARQDWLRRLDIQVLERLEARIEAHRLKR